MNTIADIPDWEKFERQLKAFIAKRVRVDAVDDIYGDVILRLLEHRHKFEAARNPVAWIYRVTTNQLGLTASGMKSRVQRGSAMLKKSILECCHVSLSRNGQIQDFERKECCC